jgi:hypothetical protein
MAGVIGTTYGDEPSSPQSILISAHGRSGSSVLHAGLRMLLSDSTFFSLQEPLKDFFGGKILNSSMHNSMSNYAGKFCVSEKPQSAPLKCPRLRSLMMAKYLDCNFASIKELEEAVLFAGMSEYPGEEAAIQEMIEDPDRTWGSGRFKKMARVWTKNCLELPRKVDFVSSKSIRVNGLLKNLYADWMGQRNTGKDTDNSDESHELHRKRLKVIHLYRDPRAIFHSRVKAKWVAGYDKWSKVDLEMYFKSMCSNTEADIYAGLAQGNTTYKLVVYDDLILDSERVLTSILEFAYSGTTAADGIVERKNRDKIESTRKKFFDYKVVINSNITDTRGRGNAYSVDKGSHNGTSSTHEWGAVMPAWISQTVVSECSKLFQLVGHHSNDFAR